MTSDQDMIVSPLGVILAGVGKTQRELGKLLGSRSRASELVTGKRFLTRDQMVVIHREWGIAFDVMLSVQFPELLALRPKEAGEAHRALSIARNYLLDDAGKPRDKYAADDLEIIDAALASPSSPVSREPWRDTETVLPSPPEPATPDVAMARHWIDRYAAGIDEEPQMDRIIAALKETGK